MDPMNLPALVEDGERLFLTGDTESALARFSAAVDQDPTCARAWNGLALSLHSQGKLDEAVSALRQGIGTSPDSPDLLVNLAQVLCEKDALEEGLLHARRALALAPHDEGAHRLLESLGLEGPPRPRALLFMTGRLIGRLRPALRALLRARGFDAREVMRDVVASLSDDDDAPMPDAALRRYLERIAPALVIAESSAAEADALASWGLTAEVPVVLLGEPCVPKIVKPALHLPVDPAASLESLAAWLSTFEPARPPLPAHATHPLLSLIIPTFDRARCLRNLLDRLAIQDLDPSLFEVLVTDDGSPSPVTEALGDLTTPYALKILRQPNAGPAAARNRAIAEARGRWLVIYNDDALPERDNLRRHLLGQAGAPAPVAILGTFEFVRESLAHPFVELLQNSNLLFEYRKMKPGQLHGWQHFYTCNLSLPRDAVLQVGGFDPEFPHAICEDVELGFRLEKELGIRVLYDPRIRAWHDHDLDVRRYVRRQFKLGLNVHRLWKKHGDAAAPPGTEGAILDSAFWLRVRKHTELAESDVRQAVERVAALETSGLEGAPGTALRLAELGRLEAEARHISHHEYRRGLLAAEHGFSEEQLRNPGDLSVELTSIIMPNLNGFPHLRDAIASLRLHTRGPYELLIVDNGSSDGSLEWLRQQLDVTLLEMGENIGAPAARNRALEIARGSTILFTDNDVVFTPRWREILLGHLNAWPDIGMVGPMSDYVSGGQKCASSPAPGQSLDDFARSINEKQAGEHYYTSRLILFFLLVRREVIDAIGGIDEGYGRWGFEDDDFCLRARIGGFHLRIAADCFIRHLGSRTSQTAGIDYRRLLLENWAVFKRKWGLDSALAYGSPYSVESLLARSFDRERDFIPFQQPSLACTTGGEAEVC